MDFELIDGMRSFASEQMQRDDDRRLGLITAELAKQLAGARHVPGGRSSASRTADREAQGFVGLRQCNGCEIDIGKALGAGHIALCWVQKVSNLILNINVEVRQRGHG